MLKNWKQLLGWGDARNGFEIASNAFGMLTWFFVPQIMRYTMAEKHLPEGKRNMKLDMACTGIGISTYFVVRALTEKAAQKVGVKNPSLNFLISIVGGVLSRQFFQSVIFTKWLQKRNKALAQMAKPVVVPPSVPGQKFSVLENGPKAAAQLPVAPSPVHMPQYVVPPQPAYYPPPQPYYYAPQPMPYSSARPAPAPLRV